jgi:hypothetical protein
MVARLHELARDDPQALLTCKWPRNQVAAMAVRLLHSLGRPSSVRKATWSVLEKLVAEEGGAFLNRKTCEWIRESERDLTLDLEEEVETSTPLMMAARYGDSHMLSFLMERGARDDDAHGALYVAVCGLRVNAVRLLMRNALSSSGTECPDRREKAMQTAVQTAVFALNASSSYMSDEE